MWAKILAPVAANRLVPASRFPQLRLQLGKHRELLRFRQPVVPLASFDATSVDVALRHVAPGDVVEIRKDSGRLLGLGFFEPQRERVDVFDFASKNVTSLLTVDEALFVRRVRRSWARRTVQGPAASLPPLTTAYRLINGAADGIPSLYVDHFAAAYARVVATTFGAERLVPAVVELLRQHGTEQVLLDSPTLGVAKKCNLSVPTLAIPSMRDVYTECGNSFSWFRNDECPDTVGVDRTRLVNTAHRPLRQLLRELSHGKHVWCLFDRCGAASLSAAMTAKRVDVLVPSEGSIVDEVRETHSRNHGPAALKQVLVHELDVASSLKEALRAIATGVPHHAIGVVSLEHHPRHLASAQQWQQAVSAVLSKCPRGSGMFLLAQQETAPLGAVDLQERDLARSDGSRCATRRELCAAVLRAAADQRVACRLVREFGATCDHNLAPGLRRSSAAFSQVFYVSNERL